MSKLAKKVALVTGGPRAPGALRSDREASGLRWSAVAHPEAAGDTSRAVRGFN
jgi:hypothetical protein